MCIMLIGRNVWNSYYGHLPEELWERLRNIQTFAANTSLIHDTHFVKQTHRTECRIAV
jgi:hypothetical protein